MSEICILYCLSKREMTIYSVRKSIGEYFGAFTKPSHGTVHPALKKLLSDGFVSVKNILSSGGKKSSYYSLSDKGEKYFATLMLSDYSDNPSVSLNEINIRLCAFALLSRDNRQLFIEKTLHFLELYELHIERSINNEYSGFDQYQINLLKYTYNTVTSYKKFISDLKV